jgi:uncharacterized protein (TIGR03032 family)
VNKNLHATAAGHNAVIELPENGEWRRVWWPKCIEKQGRPDFSRNYLQLNSIAAGTSLKRSFFTASAEAPGRRFPGDIHFPVDRRGVIFSGATREVFARGLTRPHSLRFFRNRLWLNNSGYGEVGYIDGGRFAVMHRLHGWTRGLAFCGNVAIAGTSRVIPRFRRYAPGVDASKSECGLHLLDLKTGQCLGSLLWPDGNQIFGVECIPRFMRAELPFSAPQRKSRDQEIRMFYSYRLTADGNR